MAGAPVLSAARTRRVWDLRDTIAVLIVTLAGGYLRFIHLSDPRSIVFDETYYANDACRYVHPTARMCEHLSEVHPPLGKWLIAAGIKVFGFDSFGWRISSAIAGTITIALLYLLARRIFRSWLGATVAAGLLAVDLLHLVQSRIAMLDIFVPFFGVAAVLFAVIDRDRSASAPSGPASRRAPLARPWRLAAGIAAGAAVASKWSGALIVVAILALTIAWEVGSRRRRGIAHPWGRAALEEGSSILLWLVVAPALVYVATYVTRLDGAVLAWPWTDGSWFRAFWDQQAHMAGFHRTLDVTHAYQSPPWSWILLKRPVSYFYCPPGPCAHGISEEILATGDPFVWWSSIVALVYVAARWVRVRDPVKPEGLILAGFVITYVPWIVLASGRPAVFLFYLLPAVPFMCLALGYVAEEIAGWWEGMAAVALFSAGAIGLFAFYYPVATKRPLTYDQWKQRMWKFDHCDKPQGSPTTRTETQTTSGKPTTTTLTGSTTDDEPPPGWCWI